MISTHYIKTLSIFTVIVIVAVGFFFVVDTAEAQFSGVSVSPSTVNVMRTKAGNQDVTLSGQYTTLFDSWVCDIQGQSGRGFDHYETQDNSDIRVQRSWGAQINTGIGRTVTQTAIDRDSCTNDTHRSEIMNLWGTIDTSGIDTHNELGNQTITVEVQQWADSGGGSVSGPLNWRSTNVTLSVTAPDVYVKTGSITMSPASPQAGDNVTFTATIENGGSVSTIDGVSTGFTVNPSTNIGSPNVAAIGGGGTRTTSATWNNATAGSHRVQVCADDTGGIIETDEANNCAFLDFIISQPPRTLNVTVNGSGAVTSNPAGITCGTAGNSCTQEYQNNTFVDLSQSAASGWTFSGWSGDCNSSGDVTMNSDKSCTATFVTLSACSDGIDNDSDGDTDLDDPGCSSSGDDNETENFTLSLTKQGTGSGSVTSNPAGISCGTGCGSDSASYTDNTTVTLSQSPASGSYFFGWGGNADCASANDTTSVLMDMNESCTATFDLITADLKANGSDGPISITSGNSATLTWSSAGAGSCTGTNFNTGGAANNGSGVSVSPTSNTTYSINCDGATDSVTVNVTTDNVLQVRSTVDGSATAGAVISGTNSMGGTTQYDKTQTSGISTTLTAPATFSGADFSSWSGCDSVSGANCTASVSGGATQQVTAAYTTPGVTTGDITVNATLDGSPWPSSGTDALSYTLSGPTTLNGTAVPTTHTDVPTGTWNVSYDSGGPANATFSGDPLQQSLSENGAITFTLEFTSDPEPPGTPECRDTVDNDGDGFCDWSGTGVACTDGSTLGDPGCVDGDDDDERNTLPQCDDDADNDGDGLTDFDGGDPGCESADDDDETDAECSDEIDNDGDGLIDFPDDPQCDSSNDESEDVDLQFEEF